MFIFFAIRWVLFILHTFFNVSEVFVKPEHPKALNKLSTSERWVDSLSDPREISVNVGSIPFADPREISGYTRPFALYTFPGSGYLNIGDFICNF